MMNHGVVTIENMTMDFSNVPQDFYENIYTGSNAKYNGLEAPSFCTNYHAGKTTSITKDSTLTFNSASNFGVYVETSAEITNSTIKGTVALSTEVAGATATITNTTVSGGVVAYFPDDIIAVETSGNSKTYTVSSTGTPVVKVGNTGYLTLSDAINEAKSGATITLVADITIEVTGNALTIPTGKDITLDLNGHEVVGSCGTGTTSALILNKGTLVIKDSSENTTGKIEAYADPVWVYSASNPGGYASDLIRNEGTLTIESGNLYNAGAGSAAYVIDYSAGKVIINGGKLDTANASAIRMFNNNGGELTVNDGILGHYTSDSDRTYMAVQVQSAGTNGVKVTLNGGTYSGLYSVYAGSGTSWDTSSFEITGGTYEREVGFTGTFTNVEVKGGTFKAFCGSYGDEKFIKGGTFSEDPSD